MVLVKTFAPKVLAVQLGWLRHSTCLRPFKFNNNGSLKKLLYHVSIMIALQHPEHLESQATRIDRIVAASASYSAWPSEVRKEYNRNVRDRLYREGKFFLALGLAICLASTLIDYWVSPALALDGLVLRTIFILPISSLGLLSIKFSKPQLLSWCLALSQVAFAGVLIHLASHLDSATSAQYYLATALLLGIGNIIVPYSVRGMIRFNVSCIAAVIGIVLVHDIAQFFDRLDFLATLVLVSAATLPVAYRSEMLRQRNFLLATRHRMASDELVQANRLLRELSERDSLTGMYNRRYFERAFEEGCKADKLGGPGLQALMMIDLDHFKAFNDRHGHQAGDHCLRTVGGTLRETFAENTGLVARYGGEEFIGAVRVKSVRQAYNLAENLRQAVLNLPGRTSDAPLVTTSVGIAVVPVAMNLTLEDIIEMADTALYSAKRAGRNRVELIEAGQKEALSA